MTPVTATRTVAAPDLPSAPPRRGWQPRAGRAMQERDDHLSRSDSIEQEATARDLERMVFFSDAVFAIAMTLLVLELKVPILREAHTSTDLVAGLLAQRSKYLSHALSFAVLAAYWVNHRRTFRQVVHEDAWLGGLTRLLLFLVVLVPFPTAVLGEYPGEAPAAILYASILALTGLAAAAVRRRALRKLPPVHGAKTASGEAGTFRGCPHRLPLNADLVAPVVFLASIPLAFASADAAMYSWSLIAVAIGVLRLIGGTTKRLN